MVPASGEAQSFPPAASYEAYYDQLMEIRPLAEQSAAVSGITLKRDVGELQFESGRIWLLTPVNGRTLGLVFQGRGRFRFSPPSAMEQERLRDRKKVTTMNEPFIEAVIFFGDSTLEELRSKLTFGPGEDGDGLRGRIREAFSYLGKDDKRSFDPDVMLTLLNGERNDLFYAHLVNRGDPWIFMIDPAELEGVRLLVRPSGTGFTRFAEVVTQFPRGRQPATALEYERYPELRVKDYKIEITLTQDIAADLRFQADARLEIASDTATGPWTGFVMYGKLEVDSARWGNGEAAEVFKPKDYFALYVRMPQRLEAGESATLRLFYHGNVIDRFGEWFFINTSISWYPISMETRNLATFDLTFHYPRSLTLASVGKRVDSTVVGTVRTTRWVTDHPVRNASFNLGIFDEVSVSASQPQITLLWSDRGHREAFRDVLTQSHPQEVVGNDLTEALKFYRTVFGELTVDRFYATEIPWSHGEAFPGMINLSFITFVQTSEDGFDEFFRAHEVAHQYWAIGVDYATYHDRWISEGFASFSGLWFMQTRRGDNRRYFNMLDRWQADIMLHRDEGVPIWLGHRVASVGRGVNYQAIVYQKGAWVLHMLRMLTLDLATMKEDRFTNIMREFYRAYNGSRASTEDFRRVVERIVGTDMGWFFDQWVYNSVIPSYRFAWRSDKQPDGTYRVRLRVQQERVPESFLMYVPVTVELGNNRLARVRVKITGAMTDVVLPVALPSEPRAVKFNDMHGVLADVERVSWPSEY